MAIRPIGREVKAVTRNGTNGRKTAAFLSRETTVAAVKKVPRSAAPRT